jgi:hypothetical protein
MSNERSKLWRERIAGCTRGVSSRREDGDQPTSNPLELSANLLHVDENRACGYVPPVPPCSWLHPRLQPPPSLGVHALGRPRIRTRARRHGVPRLSRLSHCRGTSAFEIDESSSEMRVHRARPAESIESIFPKSRRHRRRRRHSPGVSPRLRVRSQRAEDDPRGQRRRRRRRRDREDSKTRRMRPRDSRWMRIKICALYELISSSSEQERERRVLGCDN